MQSLGSTRSFVEERDMLEIPLADDLAPSNVEEDSTPPRPQSRFENYEDRDGGDFDKYCSEETPPAIPSVVSITRPHTDWVRSTDAS